MIAVWRKTTVAKTRRPITGSQTSKNQFTVKTQSTTTRGTPYLTSKTKKAKIAGVQVNTMLTSM